MKSKECRMLKLTNARVWVTGTRLSIQQSLGQHTYLPSLEVKDCGHEDTFSVAIGCNGRPLTRQADAMTACRLVEARSWTCHLVLDDEATVVLYAHVKRI